MITADLVVKNAPIHTMNPAQPTASWFAVIGGDVVAVGSAQVTGSAKRRGSISPGMVADFVALDQDILTTPPESLPDIRVVQTWVGGSRVFVQ